MTRMTTTFGTERVQAWCQSINLHAAFSADG